MAEVLLTAVPLVALFGLIAFLVVWSSDVKRRKLWNVVGALLFLSAVAVAQYGFRSVFTPAFRCVGHQGRPSYSSDSFCQLEEPYESCYIRYVEIFWTREVRCEDDDDSWDATRTPVLDRDEVQAAIPSDRATQRVRRGRDEPPDRGR